MLCWEGKAVLLTMSSSLSPFIESRGSSIVTASLLCAGGGIKGTLWTGGGINCPATPYSCCMASSTTALLSVFVEKTTRSAAKEKTATPTVTRCVVLQAKHFHTVRDILWAIVSEGLIGIVAQAGLD